MFSVGSTLTARGGAEGNAALEQPGPGRSSAVDPDTTTEPLLRQPRGFNRGSAPFARGRVPGSTATHWAASPSRPPNHGRQRRRGPWSTPPLLPLEGQGLAAHSSAPPPATHRAVGQLASRGLPRADVGAPLMCDHSPRHSAPPHLKD